ncbi:MAG: hypothetical protein J6X28_02015 [Bacilli bacterium]|nr:hypothetical protein [Bacilli bacterium]
MPKIHIKVTIKNEEEDTSYETQAILQEECLKYKENQETTVQYQYDHNILIRENKELKMEYTFNLLKPTQGTIQIKELGEAVKIPIKTKRLERNNHNIEICFMIEEKEFLYRIEEIV